MHQKQFDLGRFTDPSLFILASLANGHKHSYAMTEDIFQFCNIRLEPGTLYAVLARLERRGWIEGENGEEPLRPYRITAPGLFALQDAEEGSQREEGSDRLRGKGIIMRLVIWMLCLYPQAWRERYEAEMVALLEQHNITFWTVLDLLVGALDARLDPHYRLLRPLSPFRRLKTSWWLIIAAGVAFWLGFAF